MIPVTNVFNIWLLFEALRYALKTLSMTLMDGGEYYVSWWAIFTCTQNQKIMLYEQYNKSTFPLKICIYYFHSERKFFKKIEKYREYQEKRDR